MLRATIVIIASYVFFYRGECNACALLGDLVVSNTHIMMLLRHDKGRKGFNAGYKSVRQIASNDSPRIAALLRACFEGQT